MDFVKAPDFKQWLVGFKARIRQSQIKAAVSCSIFTKCKSIHEALFYVQKTIDNGFRQQILTDAIYV